MMLLMLSDVVSNTESRSTDEEIAVLLIQRLDVQIVTSPGTDSHQTTFMNGSLENKFRDSRTATIIERLSRTQSQRLSVV